MRGSVFLSGLVFTLLVSPAASSTQTCWQAGWRNSDDSSALPNRSCSQGKVARRESDGHQCNSGTVDNCDDEMQCCQQNCYHTGGFRDLGDTTGTNQCPAGSTARSQDDMHMYSGAQGECCKYECTDWKETCAGTKTLSRNFYYGHEIKSAADKCCVDKCESSFSGSCPVGQVRKSMSKWENCGSDGCSTSECCMATPSQDQWNCWYFDSDGKGWRDPGDTTGTLQCPVGTFARGSSDMHQSGASGTRTEAECCQKSCWSQGWRNDGDTSGTKQCPAGSVARGQDDMHNCGDNCASAAECCMNTCYAAGWRAYGDSSGTKQCSQGTQTRSSTDFHDCGDCTDEVASQCCRPTCGGSGISSSSCPAGSTFKGSGHMCSPSATQKCTVNDCCEMTCQGAGFDAGQCVSGTALLPNPSSNVCSTTTCDWTHCCAKQVKGSETCWSHGFRSNGETTGSIQCPANTTARPSTDGHQCGSDISGTMYCRAGECCRKTCYATGGFRDPGDASGSNQCPAGSTARGPEDGHTPSGALEFTAAECCRNVCSGWSGTCPSPKILRSPNTYYGYQSAENECCKLTCQLAFQGSCPAGKIKKTMTATEYCYGSTCSSDECCVDKPAESKWNCWYWGAEGNGWRDHGDNSGSHQCPQGTQARGMSDGHQTGPNGLRTEAECCQRRCWASGWRDNGDASGIKQCPTDFRARGITDGHDCGSNCADSTECCRPTCKSAGYSQQSDCPAGMTFKGATQECYRSSTTCSVKDCCQQTCAGAGFTQSSCAAGLTVRPTSDYYYCNTGSCSNGECCGVSTSSSSTCWAAGFRDFDSSESGARKCPEGQMARSQSDQHSCGPICFAEECCFQQCWASGWRNAGDASGSQQCPSGLVARESTDNHMCSGTSCSQSDCCSDTCKSLAGQTCPSDKSLSTGYRCGSATCTLSGCCFVSCKTWAATVGNSCPADKPNVKKDHGCDSGQVSGCSAGKCCASAEETACDKLCADFDTNCNANWLTSNSACSGTTKCDLSTSCEQTSSTPPSATDPTACETALKKCVTCTPAYCDACLKCHAKLQYGITLTINSANAKTRQVTSFHSEVVMDDVTKFDQSKYMASVAAAADVDASNVEIESVAYQVTVGYSFDGEVSTSQAKTAIASVSGVSSDKVTVQASGGGGRRLGTSYTATIETDDGTQLADIAAKSADVGKLSNALQAAGASVTPTVAAAPVKKVKVKTKLKSDPGAAPVMAPAAGALSSQLSTRLGVSAQAAVSNEAVGQPDVQGTASNSIRQTTALGLSLLVYALALRA